MYTVYIVEIKVFITNVSSVQSRSLSSTLHIGENPMKLVSKTFAGILLAALSFCAFAQTAPVTASTPPVKLADDTDDKKATAFDVADANVEALCARLKAAGTPASQNAALRELGKFRTHCLGNGNGGTAAGSKPAGGNTTGNADAFKALAEELAAAKRALQASAAEAASCPTGSWHIFQAPTGAFTRFCKGQKDEVYLPPTPAVVQQVAPVADPAIVHNAGAARVVTGATPVGAASPQAATGSQGFQPCVLRSNGKATLRSSGKLLAINEVIATTPLLAAAEMFPNLKTTAEICSAWSNKAASDLTVTTTQ